MNIFKGSSTKLVKVDLESLPDAILQLIIKQVAGKLVYDEACYGYQRKQDNNVRLRRIRLVNKRLSRMAQLELYRVPSTLTHSEYPLDSDDLHVLLCPGVIESAEFLSLAGTSAFFAGLLASRFLNLISLTLKFSIPYADLIGGSDPTTILEPKFLERLRTILQALPLRELYIYFREGLECSKYEYLTTIMLAAGHPTLQHLSIDNRPGEGLDSDNEQDLPLSITYDTAPDITSLRGRDLSVKDVKILQIVLGTFSSLCKISVQFRQRPSDPEETLNALVAGFNHRITHLDITTASLRNWFWEGLTSLPNLRCLSLHSAASFNQLQFYRACFPSLETIILDGWDISGTKSVLRQAANHRSLPSLVSIRIKAISGQFEQRHIKGLRGLLDAYDKLVVARSEITVTPTKLRESIVRRLTALEERGGS